MDAPTPLANFVLAYLAVAFTPTFLTRLLFGSSPNSSQIAHEVLKEVQKNRVCLTDSYDTCPVCDECSCPVALAPSALWIVILIASVVVVVAVGLIVQFTCCITRGKPYRPLELKGKGVGKGKVTIIQ